MNICVYGASSEKISPTYLQAGEALGRYFAENGHGVIFGAGKYGMMGAVARGVHEKGGRLIGVTPTFFVDMGVVYDQCTELHKTYTMNERKLLLRDFADAFLVTPGGIGTMDEFFEVLTLYQLNRIAKPIALYNINGYYDELLKMIQSGIDENFMSARTTGLFGVVTTPQEAVEYFSAHLNQSANYNKYDM